MGLHSLFPGNERGEFCKCDEYYKSLVFRFRRSSMYSLFKTLAQTANLLNCRKILFFSYAFRVTIKRTRTASQQVLQHTTQNCLFMAESASGKDES